MGKLLSSLATILVIFLSLPTFLILVSWNALPGDSLYSVKTGLEDIALILTGETPVARALTVRYTERRFSEAKSLFARERSTVGFALLVQETEQSSNLLVKTQDRQNAAVLITKIEEYKTEIERQKAEIVSQPAFTPKPTFQQPTPSPTVSPTPTPTPTPSTSDVVEELEETEEKLEEIKKKLEEKLPEAAKEHRREFVPQNKENRLRDKQ